MDSEDPLFILYTSGTTGKPKGTLHVQGSFTVFAAQQTAYLIDLKDSDLLFWPADIGWITGQTWTVYGSLILGSTALVYDGAPNYPEPDRLFRMIDDHKVTIFGASPTVIRLFMKYDKSLRNYRLDTLRILASTGELLNPDEWNWFFEKVGKSRCPIMNLSGGTEVGGAILSPLPISSLKPSTVGGPVPGFDVDVFDESGKSVRGVTGYLVIKKPWPGMTRGLWGKPDRYIKTYWSKYEDVWLHGDWAVSDLDGLWYLYGRIDDVIKVAGHRIGSAEIEAVVSHHPAVLEAVAIGIPHELKGEAIILYIVLKQECSSYESIKQELKTYVADRIGKISKPEDVKIVGDLPKTRTGKIVRRLIRAKLLKIELGDLSSLENPDSIQALDNPA